MPAFEAICKNGKKQSGYFYVASTMDTAVKSAVAWFRALGLYGEGLPGTIDVRRIPKRDVLDLAELVSRS
jgi:hypothetical protein